MSEEFRGAFHRERFAKLQSEFDELVKLGGAGTEDFKVFAFRLLKSFEVARLKNFSQIQKLREEIAFCEATSKACDMFENLLIGLIEAHKNDKQRGVATQVNTEGAPITDVELLRTICICGCRDEEDARSCDCSCHKGVPCSSPQCTVCAAKLM